MEYSPQLASTLGKEYGNLGTNIGKYLSDLGNTRASMSLSARLGIDPYSTYSPYLNTDIGQSNSQANANYQYALQKAQADYNDALKHYQNRQAKYKTIGSIDPLAGGIYGGISGGESGVLSSLGGTQESVARVLSFVMSLLGRSEGTGISGLLSTGNGGIGKAQTVNTSSMGNVLAAPSNYYLR
jgi:hypothetical protein